MLERCRTCVTINPVVQRTAEGGCGHRVHCTVVAATGPRPAAGINQRLSKGGILEVINARLLTSLEGENYSRLARGVY